MRGTGFIKDYFNEYMKLRELGIVHAHHDRSYGALFSTIIEMALQEGSVSI